VKKTYISRIFKKLFSKTFDILKYTIDPTEARPANLASEESMIRLFSGEKFVELLESFGIIQHYQVEHNANKMARANMFCSLMHIDQRIAFGKKEKTPPATYSDGVITLNNKKSPIVSLVLKLLEYVDYRQCLRQYLMLVPYPGKNNTLIRKTAFSRKTIFSWGWLQYLESNDEFRLFKSEFEDSLLPELFPKIRAEGVERRSLEAENIFSSLQARLSKLKQITPYHGRRQKAELEFLHSILDIVAGEPTINNKQEINFRQGSGVVRDTFTSLYLMKGLPKYYLDWKVNFLLNSYFNPDWGGISLEDYFEELRKMPRNHFISGQEVTIEQVFPEYEFLQFEELFNTIISPMAKIDEFESSHRVKGRLRNTVLGSDSHKLFRDYRNKQAMELIQYIMTDLLGFDVGGEKADGPPWASGFDQLYIHP
jgi:hypothetical protein